MARDLTQAVDTAVSQPALALDLQPHHTETRRVSAPTFAPSLRMASSMPPAASPVAMVDVEVAVGA